MTINGEWCIYYDRLKKKILFRGQQRQDHLVVEGGSQRKTCAVDTKTDRVLLNQNQERTGSSGPKQSIRVGPIAVRGNWLKEHAPGKQLYGHRCGWTSRTMTVALREGIWAVVVASTTQTDMAEKTWRT